MSSVHPLRFAFGKNWRHFVDAGLHEGQVERAAASLCRMLGGNAVAGAAFLDVGCGSGLFSLAALRLGAERVVAFDYDAASVEAARKVREQSGILETKWQILQGSVVDDEFVDALEPSDVVYAWGVLHHTGHMWKAIDNAASRVKPGRLFALAIYNEVEHGLGRSSNWWRIKRLYNRLPEFGRATAEASYVAAKATKHLLRLRNPVRAIRDHGAERGMDFWHDMRDWLGGFPYEYARASDVFAHVGGRLGMELVYLSTTSGPGCNEFTFRRPALPAGALTGR